MQTDQTKVRISWEILSGGAGYRVFHRKGAYIYCVATSREHTPPDYLADRWWKLVNEVGNTVGLKVKIITTGFPNIYPARRMTLRRRVGLILWRLDPRRRFGQPASGLLTLAEPPEQ